jgi:hypothetical protein
MQQKDDDEILSIKAEEKSHGIRRKRMDTNSERRSRKPKLTLPKSWLPETKGNL